MLRLDDLTVRTTELNRRADAINQYGWQITDSNTGRKTSLGTVLLAALARLTRNTSTSAGRVPSTMRAA